jgi:hypothetical protein
MAMKLLQFLLLLFLLLGFLIFQFNHPPKNDWYISEDSLDIKLKYISSWEEEVKLTNLWFDAQPLTSFSNQNKLFSQIKKPFTVILSYFQRTSPFWRPPPGLIF